MLKTIATLCLLAGLFPLMPAADAETLYGVSSSDSLVSFDSTNPNIVDFIDPITGLLHGQTVASLSFNAALDAIFALGVNAQTGLGNLYELNLSDGVATPFDSVVLFPVTGSPTTVFTSSATGLQYLATTSHGVTELFAADPSTTSLTLLGIFANGAMPLAGIAAVPEPGTLPLLFLGLCGILLCSPAKIIQRLNAGT